MTIPFEVAVRATGARVIGADRRPDAITVSTDTRTLRPGDAFLALHGERYEGHDFVRQAIAGGAGAVIVDRESAIVSGAPALLVTATLQAYMALASAARERFAGHVIAITGSTGKTTTKVLLEQLLRAAGLATRAAPANENNEIGVSKLLLAASEEDALVVEIGARHPGDIAALVEIARPHCGVLTNVGEAHLAIMGSREVLEETKWGLFSQGANAVLNAEDDASRRRAGALQRPPWWFAAKETSGELPDVKPLCALLDTHLLVVGEDGERREHRIDVRLPGRHNRENLAAALAVLASLGMLGPRRDARAVLAAISNLVLPPGRYERIAPAFGPEIIYDAYNANVQGMIAALDAFSHERATRRIAVLASMAELGSEAETMHERVGERVAVTADWLLAGGEHAAGLIRGATRAGLPAERAVSFGSNEEAAAWLRDNARRGDLALLKGSRKYRLEEIVEALR